jgi:hypothetical protein
MYVSVSPPATFLEAHLGFGGWCFHLLNSGSKFPAHQECCLCQAPLDHVDPRREPLSCRAKEVSSSCTKEPGKGLGTKLGAPLIRLVRTWVQIQASVES